MGTALYTNTMKMTNEKINWLTSGLFSDSDSHCLNIIILFFMVMIMVMSVIIIKINIILFIISITAISIITGIRIMMQKTAPTL